MSKNFFYLILLLLLMFNNTLFAAGKADSIDVDKFDELRKEGYTVIDVRTQEEYDDGHVEGAILINLYSSDFKDKIAALDKDGKYLVYCRSGVRSLKAASYMNDAGIKNVLHLSGGIIAWKRANKPLVN